MRNVVLFQSASPHRSPWIDACMATVRHWALTQDWHYRFLGDELFDTLEADISKKLAGRNPIKADIGRLDLLHTCLTGAEAPDSAVWVDADTLCIDPTWTPDLSADSVFGEECWVQQRQGGTWRRYLSPHNAYMSFNRGSPVLPFLRFAARSIVGRIDEHHMAPQIVGPKLLKALHNLVPFTLQPQAGALSPALRDELLDTPGPAVNCYRQAQRPPLALVNLCQSLIDDNTTRAVITLIDEPHRFAALSTS